MWIIVIILSIFLLGFGLYASYIHHELEYYKKLSSDQKKVIEDHQMAKNVELFEDLRRFFDDVRTGKVGMIAVTRVDTDNLLYRSSKDSAGHL